MPLLIALAACSGQERADESGAQGETPGQAATPAPVTQETDAAFDLAGVSGADSEAVALEGELGCSFSTQDGAMLLIGRGWSGVEEPAQAMARLNGTPVKLISDSADGFGGLFDGGTYSGGGLTVRVAMTSEEDSDPSEGSAKPARLSASLRGQERDWNGTWTCGP